MSETLPRNSAGDADALLGLESSAGKGRIRRRKFAVLAVALGLLAAIAYGMSRPSSGGTVYQTEPVLRGALHVVVTATGSVQPTSQVEVSSEQSGTVRRVLVDYNSAVTTGQLLAELDTDKFKANLDSSRAKLDSAKAKVGNAEITVAETSRELERKRALLTSSYGSRHDFDTAKAAYDRAVAGLASARADVAAAEAELTLNASNLAKTRIVSPIDGVVLKRNVDPGQTVAASLQAPVLFTIAEDLRRMEVQVDVDEADVGRVREGQSASFSVDAHPDRRFPAGIRELRYAPETVQGVVTYKAVLTVDNSALLLRPGMTATAEIAVQDVQDALLVPNAALRFSPPATAQPQQSGLLKRLLPGMPSFRPASQPEPSGPSRTVWILNETTPEAVPVTVGATDGKRTQILSSDLKEGQKLVVDAATRP